MPFAKIVSKWGRLSDGIITPKKWSKGKRGVRRMSEAKYTHYIVPHIPIYAYYFYDDFLSKKKGNYIIEKAPVVAFGCYFEDGENNTVPLIIPEEGATSLCRADEYLKEFLGCYCDPNLDIKYFFVTITLRKGLQKKKAK
jgi:hypothetical protein